MELDAGKTGPPDTRLGRSGGVSDSLGRRVSGSSTNAAASALRWVIQSAGW